MARSDVGWFFLKESLNGTSAIDGAYPRITKAINTKETGLSTLWLSFPLAVLVAVAACLGLFSPIGLE